MFCISTEYSAQKLNGKKLMNTFNKMWATVSVPSYLKSRRSDSYELILSFTHKTWKTELQGNQMEQYVVICFKSQTRKSQNKIALEHITKNSRRRFSSPEMQVLLCSLDKIIVHPHSTFGWIVFLTNHLHFSFVRYYTQIVSQRCERFQPPTLFF